MIKLLHTADLHLDSPLRTLALRNDDLRNSVENATRMALVRIVDIALDEGVAAVLIAGDLYDGGQRSMKTAAFLTAQFRRLAEGGIRVFLIRGNHDAESRITREIGWPDTVHVFDGRGGHRVLGETGIAIHGISFREPHCAENLVGRFRPVPGMVNIAMLHTSLAGAQGHDVYAPCRLSDLADAGFDYWALGHVHSRTVHLEDPVVVMPGMPQGRDIGESGEKSVTLIEIDDGRIAVRECPSAALIFRRVECDVAGAGDIGDLYDLVRTALHDLVSSTPQVVRLTLTGRTALNWRLRRDLDVIAQTIAETAQPARIWIDQIVAATEPPTEEVGAGAAAELAALIAEIAAQPGFKDEVQVALAEVVHDLPQQLRDVFGADSAAQADAVQALIGEATDGAIARILSVGSDG